MKRYVQELVEAMPGRWRLLGGGTWSELEEYRSGAWRDALEWDAAGAPCVSDLWAFWGPLATEFGVTILEWEVTGRLNESDGILEHLAALVVAKAKDRNPAGEGEN